MSLATVHILVCRTHDSGTNFFGISGDADLVRELEIHPIHNRGEHAKIAAWILRAEIGDVLGYSKGVLVRVRPGMNLQ